MSERRRILREVIYLAHEGGYDGPGNDWDSAPAQELDRILETGEHIPVLKSPAFSRPFFWHILSPDTVSIPAGSIPDPEEGGDDEDEIEAQVAAMGDELAEAEDPLEYLKHYVS